MRVFEIAREAGVSSVDVIKAAESVGVDVSSAISTIDGGDADRIREALGGADKSAMAARRASKAKIASQLNAAFFAEQKTRLAE
ncbi:MAG: translation initiation factor IF-2 N-terminal domain-containing protein, partial [Kiritimatiellae bacterium]|nr:translation initiation factor IF-2 N-terminal domain-containing protein [Kiritimatiellia bacterium]